MAENSRVCGLVSASTEKHVHTKNVHFKLLNKKIVIMTVQTVHILYDSAKYRALNSPFL